MKWALRVLARVTFPPFPLIPRWARLLWCTGTQDVQKLDLRCEGRSLCLPRLDVLP